LLDIEILQVDQGADLAQQMGSLLRQAHDHAPLISQHGAARNQLDFFHPRQHTGHAGTRYLAQFADFFRLQLSMLIQRSQNAPLLFGDVEAVQDGSKIRHQAVPCFEHALRQIWVSDLVFFQAKPSNEILYCLSINPF